MRRRMSFAGRVAVAIVGALVLFFLLQHSQRKADRRFASLGESFKMEFRSGMTIEQVRSLLTRRGLEFTEIRVAHPCGMEDGSLDHGRSIICLLRGRTGHAPPLAFEIEGHILHAGWDWSHLYEIEFFYWFAFDADRRLIDCHLVKWLAGL